MIRIYYILFLLVILRVPFPVQAVNDPCFNLENRPSSKVSFECSKYTLESAQSVMLKKYNKIIAFLQNAEKKKLDMDPFDPAEFMALLKQNQDEWLRYRNNHCEFETYFNSGGGEGYRVSNIRFTCLTSLTISRHEYLDEVWNAINID